MTAPTARATPTVSTRILIISDTHAADLLPSSSSGYAFREPLPPADVLLHCGDLTFQGGMDEYEGALRLLSAADAGLKLVIAGNHDTTLDGGCAARSSTLLGRRWGGARPDSGSAAAAAAAARRLWTCDDTREKGIVYLDEGVHRFTLGNGALLTVYASPYQPEYGSWAFQYPREQDRFFEPASGQARSPLVPVPAFPAVDVMMTHGPPAALLDLAASGQYAGCAYLLAALRRARPRLHCFGHIHEAYGALRVAWDEADEHARMTADADSAGAVQTGPEGQSSSGESQVDSQSWFGRGVLRKREQWPTEQDPLVLQSKPTHVKHLAFDQERALLDRCSSIDVTAAGGNPLHFGKESLVINASINNRRYRPANAPFLVSLDLPMA